MSEKSIDGTWLKRLASIADKPNRVVAGVMSGTSMDSIDAALCRIQGAGRTAQVELVAFHQQPYMPELASRLQNPAALNVRDISELNGLIGESFAHACLSAFTQAGLDAREVDLIGSHGQTVYHHSAVPGAARSTLQIGDADVIAQRTGIGVIADFRARDVAAGGEGAPLTPYADVVLYRLGQTPRRAVLNLGGIANITFIERGFKGDVIGFDTGPANAPLDRLARLFSKGTQTYDVDGAFARQGQVDERMLHVLLQDPYLRMAPPKSTGFEVYGDPFIARLTANYGRSPVT